MLDRKLESGEWGRPAADPTAHDLPLIAAALAHYERQQSATSLPPSGGGQRQAWRRRAREEGLRSPGMGLRSSRRDPWS